MASACLSGSMTMFARSAGQIFAAEPQIAARAAAAQATATVTADSDKGIAYARIAESADAGLSRRSCGSRRQSTLRAAELVDRRP